MNEERTGKCLQQASTLTITPQIRLWPKEKEQMDKLWSVKHYTELLNSHEYHKNDREGLGDSGAQEG